MLCFRDHTSSRTDNENELMLQDMEQKNDQIFPMLQNCMLV